jgi:hypothetical protein
MSKNKKFQPPAGFVVGVHLNIMGIRAISEYLTESPEELALALEKAGFAVVPDIMDLSADAAKVIKLQEKTNE